MFTAFFDHIYQFIFGHDCILYIYSFYIFDRFIYIYLSFQFKYIILDVQPLHMGNI